MNLQKIDAFLIYCRVSDARQEREGSGRRSQEILCRNLAKFYQKPVEKVFLDTFTGGGNFMRRPAMRELLGYAKEKKHKNYGVIFDDLKRFARDTKFHFELREAFTIRGLIPICLNFKFDDTPEGKFIETVHAAHNELERAQNRKQVIDKMKARLMDGYWPFLTKNCGFKFVRLKGAGGKVLVPVKKDSKIIREAAISFAQGKLYSQTDVQKFYVEQKLNGGKLLSLERVKKILTSILPTGYIEFPNWGVELRKGRHYKNALYSLEIRELIIQRLKGGVAREPGNKTDTAEDFPARGYILCSGCMKPLTAAWTTNWQGKKYPYYRCLRKKSTCKYKTVSIPRKKLHTELENILKGIKFTSEFINYIESFVIRRLDEQSMYMLDKVADHQKEIQKIETQIKNLTSRIARTIDEDIVSVYESDIKNLLNAKKKLQANAAKLEVACKGFELPLKEVMTFIKSPYFTWANGGLNQRKTLLQMLFKEKLIWVQKQGVRTPKFACGIKLLQQTIYSDYCLVDLDENNLNFLVNFIQKWGATIKKLP